MKYMMCTDIDSLPAQAVFIFSTRVRAMARPRPVDFLPDFTVSDFSSCSSKSKYPQMAVKGVRRSCEIFTTAFLSSISPC